MEVDSLKIWVLAFYLTELAKIMAAQCLESQSEQQNDN